jgi:LCP family protein required for cell wall assembly
MAQHQKSGSHRRTYDLRNPDGIDDSDGANDNSGTNDSGTNGTAYRALSARGASKSHKAHGSGSHKSHKSGDSRESSDSRKPRKTLKRVLIGVGILLVVLIVIVAIALLSFTRRVDTNLALDIPAQEEVKEVLITPPTKEEPYYVLLLGSDSRTPGSYSGRSDTIILARIDPEVPQATLLSIPRDTEIQLEGHGTQKINAAYAYGREAGAIQAVSELCDVDIAHYVEIDFEGVVGLVETLGGVTVNVPVHTEFGSVVLEPGEQTLNGEQALAFSRCRNYPIGDFQRVVNQRILIQAVTKEVLAASPIDLPGLVEQLSACMKSDLSSMNAVALLLKLRSMDADSMYMETIPSYNNYHDEISYVAVQEPEFSEMMERIKQGLPPKDPDA